MYVGICKIFEFNERNKNKKIGKNGMKNQKNKKNKLKAGGKVEALIMHGNSQRP